MQGANPCLARRGKYERPIHNNGTICYRHSTHLVVYGHCGGASKMKKKVKRFITTFMK